MPGRSPTISSCCTLGKLRFGRPGPGHACGLAGHGPRGFAGEGGAGRPGSRPVASDLIAKGTKNALLGRLRRPHDAWIGLSTMPRGVSEARLRRIRAHWPRACAGGALASTSNPVWRLVPSALALGRSHPPCQPTHRTAAPGSQSERHRCSSTLNRPRWAHDRSSLCMLHAASAYIHNGSSLSPRPLSVGAAGPVV
jgi:hypothetical protein